MSLLWFILALLVDGLAILAGLFAVTTALCDEANLWLLFILAIILPKTATATCGRGKGMHLASRFGWLFFLFYFFHRIARFGADGPELLVPSLWRAALSAGVVYGVLSFLFTLLLFSWRRFTAFRCHIARLIGAFQRRCREWFASLPSLWRRRMATTIAPPIVVGRTERIQRSVAEALQNYEAEKNIVHSAKLHPFEEEAILQEQRQQLMQNLKEILK